MKTWVKIVIGVALGALLVGSPWIVRWFFLTTTADLPKMLPL